MATSVPLVDWEEESYPAYPDFAAIPFFAVFFLAARFLLDRFVFEVVSLSRPFLHQLCLFRP
jgi:ceramide synthetase